MIRRPPRSTLDRSSAASDVYKRQVLAHLDVIILVELYPARELEIPGISSETLFLKIKHPNKHLSLKENLCNLIETLEMDVVLCLGAGDLDMMMDEIKDAVFGSTDLKKSA